MSHDDPEQQAGRASGAASPRARRTRRARALVAAAAAAAVVLVCWSNTRRPAPLARHHAPAAPVTFPPLLAHHAATHSALPIPSAGLPPARAPPAPSPAATAALHASLLDACPPVPRPLAPITSPADRAAAVRSAAGWAWAGYKRHAWGEDELAPVSRRGVSTLCSLAVTPVDALDTLWLLGLRREFEAAADWVAATLPGRLADGDACSLSVFEAAIRVVGGLSGAADVAGDARLGRLAADVATALLPAFSGGALPTGVIDIGRPNATAAAATAAAFRGAAPGTALLAETFLAPEFWRAAAWAGARGGARPTLAAPPPTRLAAAPRAAVDAVLAAASHAGGGGGLLPTTLAVETGGAEWAERHTVGGKTDSAYEYLLKMWLLLRHGDDDAHEPAAAAASTASAHGRGGGGHHRHARGGGPGDAYRAAWVAAMDAVLDRLVVTTPAGARYVSSDLHEPVLEHLACFLPGNLATGVLTGAVSGARATRYTDAATAILATCVAAGDATPTGLAPEVALFLPEVRPGHPASLLRPEVAESLYLVHRLTGDGAWRDAGWRLFSAIETHARVPSGGYSGVRDVASLPAAWDDAQPSWLLAETFKYLWLLFSEAGAALDLQGEWVFSTEAHLLRVFRKGGALP